MARPKSIIKPTAPPPSVADSLPSAPEKKAKGRVFAPLAGMIRVLRKPFAVGAQRYHFKSLVGINNANGRAIKKNVICTPVPDGAGWEEWLVQDNPGNRATIETAFRDQYFHYTPIYPETENAAELFAQAVERYASSLEGEAQKLDAQASALKEREQAIEAEMAPLFENGLTEEESKRVNDLNAKAKEVGNERFEAEKAARIARARLKPQQDLLARLG